MFGAFRQYFSTDLAIDLGTANTLIFMRDRGIVLNDAPQIGALGSRLSNLWCEVGLDPLPPLLHRPTA